MTLKSKCFEDGKSNSEVVYDAIAAAGKLVRLLDVMAAIGLQSSQTRQMRNALNNLIEHKHITKVSEHGSPTLYLADEDNPPRSKDALARERVERMLSKRDRLSGDATYRILSFLDSRTDGPGSDRIAAELRLKKAAVAAAINHARRKGYIENRAPSIRGGRAQYWLTGAGESMIMERRERAGYVRWSSDALSEAWRMPVALPTGGVVRLIRYTKDGYRIPHESTSLDGAVTVRATKRP